MHAFHNVLPIHGFLVGPIATDGILSQMVSKIYPASKMVKLGYAILQGGVMYNYAQLFAIECLGPKWHG